MMMTTMMMDDDDDASYWFCRYIITSLQTTSSLGGMKGKSLTHWIGRCQSIIEMYIYLSIYIVIAPCMSIP